MTRYLLCILFVFSSFVSGAENEVDRAVHQLNDLLALLNNMESVSERMDLPRLVLFKKRSQEVLDSIQKRGLSHMATLRTYQTLIVTFRYSSGYLQRIQTKKTLADITKLIAIVKDIVNERGFDDSPYTQLTASTFTQIRQLLLELEQSSGNATLRATVNELQPALADAIVKGSEGDRPEAFAAGISVYQKIKALYPF